MIGILAYGSILHDPGAEISAAETNRIQVRTPFRVEFARYSRSRSGAPTLVPVRRGGSFVRAEIIVLTAQTLLDDAKDMLYRRETDSVHSGARYPALKTRNAVRILSRDSWRGVETVLYTDFYAKGKIQKPKPRNLARRAIASARARRDRKDGISYLINAKAFGIRTPLMKEYEDEILSQTNAANLSEALTNQWV